MVRKVRKRNKRGLVRILMSGKVKSIIAITLFVAVFAVLPSEEIIARTGPIVALFGLLVFYVRRSWK